MTPNVFVNYRRTDSSVEATQIAEILRSYLGRDLVFQDITSTDIGAHWPKRISGALDKASHVIAIFGPDWLLASDENGRRRIDLDDDWVRRELETAIQQEKKIIPVLVRGAEYPSEEALPNSLGKLPTFQYLKLEPKSWLQDIEPLLELLGCESKGEVKSLLPSFQRSTSLKVAASTNLPAALRGIFETLADQVSWLNPSSLSLRALMNELLEADIACVDFSAEPRQAIIEFLFLSSLGTPTVVIHSSQDDGSESDLFLSSIADPSVLDSPEVVMFDLADGSLEELPRTLKSLLENAGSSGSRMLREEARELKRCVDSTLRLYHRGDLPLVCLLTGWLAQLGEDYRAFGDRVFEVDPRCYRQCLAVFQRWQLRENAEIWAIADLTESSERLFPVQVNQGGSDSQTVVSERLFLIEPIDFFNTDKLNEIKTMLDAQARDYPVRLGCKPFDDSGLHQFQEDGVGLDLLLINPQLVAGYVLKNERRMLRFEDNQVEFDSQKKRYKKIRKRTVEFVPNVSTVFSLRSAWLETSGIGRWRNDWDGSKSERVGYYEFYDYHIRCWIPNYDELVKLCFENVRRALMKTLLERCAEDGLRVLEIGLGTGALTKRLWDWLDHINGVKQTEVVPIRYLGIDESSKMVEVASKRLKSRHYANFSVGHFPETDDFGTFDVVCGNLVLHDILDPGRSEDELAGLMENIRRHIRPGGYLIMGDCLTGWDSGTKEAKAEYWNNWLATKMGLSPKEIAALFASNMNMIDTIDKKKAVKLFREHGFQPQVRFKTLPGAKASPGGLLVLRADS